MTFRTVFPLAALVGASLALAAPAAPKKPGKPAAKKPALTAEQVMQRFIDATGGEAAYNRLSSLVMTGKLEMRAQGLNGSFEIRTKTPAKMFMIQRIEGFGESKQGYDGKVAWSSDPVNGVRVLSGEESAAVERAAQFNSQVKWKDLYKSIEMLGIRKVGTVDTYAVRAVPTVGKPVVTYYDTKSFLLLRTDMVVDGPQGSIPTESYTSDYRTVAGVKMPFVTRQRVGGVAEILLTVTEATPNVEIPDSVFAKPAAPAPKTSGKN